MMNQSENCSQKEYKITAAQKVGNILRFGVSYG